MKTLNVDLGDRSYPIHIGEDLLDQLPLLIPYLPGREVLVVTNETVAPLLLDTLCEGLAVDKLDTVVLPDGEQYKSLETLNLIYDALLANRHSRGTTLVALGGGVVGDMTGFAAATYQRGVHFVQIPTTLLAQVDSSVGGKTGVNHPGGKNMIGAFHQPAAVLADVSALDTLPEREYRAGVAEVVKYGLIADRPFFHWLEDNMAALAARDKGALVYAVEQSCRNKAWVVARDEREAGLRATLNYGHTFGHAIETAGQYRGMLHGEAVAVGMVMAADMSHRLGWLDTGDLKRITALIVAAGLPVVPPAELTPERFRDLMAVDKKVSRGVLRLVLLRGIGEAVVTGDYRDSALAETLAAFCGR